MREIRTSGSEGGGAQAKGLSLPLSRLATGTDVDCMVGRPSMRMRTPAGHSDRGLVLTTVAISDPAGVTV
jgi:hypothetical protein